MGIGFSIFLIALGAILTFALHFTVAGVDIHVIGWILMAAGVIGLIVTMVLLSPRRRRTVVATQGIGTVSAANTARPVPRTVVVDEPVDRDLP